MNKQNKGIDISKAKYRDKTKSRGLGDTVAKVIKIPQRIDKPKLNHWLPLHRYGPEHVSEWNPCLASRWYFEEWKPRIPSYGCACEKHWKDLTEKYPPDFSSPKAFFEWGWARHNDVSTNHSHRPTIALEQAYLMYWSDR